MTTTELSNKTSNNRLNGIANGRWNIERLQNRGALGTSILNLLQNPQGWFIIRLENRRILEYPTVAQSETYKALSLLTDYRLSLLL